VYYGVKKSKSGIKRLTGLRRVQLVSFNGKAVDRNVSHLNILNDVGVTRPAKSKTVISDNRPEQESIKTNVSA
jgi:hypothetical protein